MSSGTEKKNECDVILEEQLSREDLQFIHNFAFFSCSARVAVLSWRIGAFALLTGQNIVRRSSCVFFYFDFFRVKSLSSAQGMRHQRGQYSVQCRYSKADSVAKKKKKSLAVRCR